MTGANKLIRSAALIALPVVAGGLWLGSGRETLTKTVRYVEVQVVDELFGDSITEAREVPGPVLGYYVGLDAVAAAVGVALVAALVWWRRRRAQAEEGL